MGPISILKVDKDHGKLTIFFKSNELSGAQNVLLPLLLSRFLLYLHKKAQDAAAIGAIKKIFVFKKHGNSGVPV